MFLHARNTPYSSLRHRPSHGFSLIEVTLALGLVAFALVAIIGIIPFGLRVEQESTEKLRGMHILSMVADDIYSVAKKYQDPANPDASGVYLLSTKAFAIPLSEPGGAKVEQTFGVDENFKKVTVDDPASKATVFCSYPAAESFVSPFKIHVVVAWPGLARITASGSGTEIKQNNGYVETLLTVNRL